MSPRNRADAARPLPPLEYPDRSSHCTDPWQCPARRGHVTAEGTRAAVQHLAGHGITGRFLVEHLRDAWGDADAPTRRLLREAAYQ